MNANAAEISIKVDYDINSGSSWSDMRQFSGKTECNEAFLFNVTEIRVTCKPIGNYSKLTIWSCEASGAVELVDLNSLIKTKETWSLTFDNHYSVEDVPVQFLRMVPSRSRLMTVRDWHQFQNSMNRPTETSQSFFTVTFALNVNRSFVIDLSASNNPMIESPDDAVQVSVIGTRLWLSKSKLSATCLFFNNLFNGDFLEKRTGQFELNNGRLHEFLRFLSHVYGMPVRITDYNVDYLRDFGDYFQCDAVIEQCEDFIKSKHF